ncbi:WD40/YVTN/BNR-like repeat-containing protein [Sungkyunkwania multivorans]|uniref:WD40/YVTN/BNR-like repeat-containing protein n=1 Tax=Sungkyunkwania multivorans TaxID=1173618 RepID=A0ABW3CX51_9FLAO
MKNIIFFFLILFLSCGKEHRAPRDFSHVEVEVIYKNESASFRAIEIDKQENLVFADNNGIVGIIDVKNDRSKFIQTKRDTLVPHYRSLAIANGHQLALSIANPALLYHSEQKDFVYTEENEKVFYDAMHFWNDEEGIAMGDPIEDCLSVIITRNGGHSWRKVSCEVLPKTEEGEAAFAASDTNIAIVGNDTWLFSGGKKSRVFYSSDKGITWTVFDTPIIQGEPAQGIYSGDFYDENHGIVIGGDYTKPEENTANKAITKDGGKTWQLVSSGKEPGYKSCVQYVPWGDAKEIMAVGFTGISYSNDGGEEWTALSDESFYTLRFLNDTVAYAAGKGRIAKLTFKQI